MTYFRANSSSYRKTVCYYGLGAMIKRPRSALYIAHAKLASPCQTRRAMVVFATVILACYSLS